MIITTLVVLFLNSVFGSVIYENGAPCSLVISVYNSVSLSSPSYLSYRLMGRMLQFFFCQRETGCDKEVR